MRRLSGYLKQHRVPDHHTQAAEQFIKRIGQPELTQHSEALHAALRSALNYKRKEMVYTAEEGLTVIKTPDFDVTLTLEQDADDPKRYVLTSLVNDFRRPEVLSNRNFVNVFCPVTDTLGIDFVQSVDVESKIDSIEEIPELAKYLHYQPDGSSLTLELPEAGMKVHMDADRMTFRLMGRRNLATLIEHVEMTLSTLFRTGMRIDS